MITLTSADGTDIRAYDEGHGPAAILIVGPGLDDGTRTRRLGAILAERFRVLRLHRRQYRLDLDVPCSVAQEAADVLALARHAGLPVVVYGHSSGGVVALEAMAASPSSFAGAVIFEPAAVVTTPWAGADGQVITRARAAIAAGKPGKALAVFTREATGYPEWQAWTAGMIAALVPRYRRLVPCQINDLQAMDELGNRLETYARFPVPTVLLAGDRSPPRNTAVLNAINDVMPHAERVIMPNRDHSADMKHPREVAQIIDTLATKVIT
ncbi:alpha/beta fold hydrolase [Nonomuraea sediminis]|uniref:alpha/beta fold hydrolase n=1 Tax=Nonomuraea sediminis TaxID=2835864 RepID=UPI001BDD6E22|nr:alpha/beta hydrolase [Nonomuraea sediminis]